MDSNSMDNLIVKRTSTRAFSGKRLTQNEIQIINDYFSHIENQTGIFHNVTFELLENKNDTVFGAYGDITGATYYVAAIAENSKEGLLDVGYSFERFMLFAESIGLGTCWLAGTSFDRNAAEMNFWLAGKEIIAAISPIGDKADKRSDIDLKTRRDYKSDDRLDFGMLFFDAKTGGRIESTATREILEFVRLAPSALNNQPWRIIMDEDTAHFYVARRTINLLEYDYQMMDMGAALYHYAAVSGKTNFYYLNPELNVEYEYVISVS